MILRLFALSCCCLAFVGRSQAASLSILEPCSATAGGEPNATEVCSTSEKALPDDPRSKRRPAMEGSAELRGAAPVPFCVAALAGVVALAYL